MDSLLAKHGLLVRLKRLLKRMGDGIQRLLERAVFVAHELGKNWIIVLRWWMLLQCLVHEDSVSHVHFLRLDLLLVIFIEECLLFFFEQLNHEQVVCNTSEGCMSSVILQKDIGFVLKEKIYDVIVIVFSSQVESCDIILTSNCIQIYKARILSFCSKPALLRLISSDVKHSLDRLIVASFDSQVES